MKNVNRSEALKLMADPETFILDVRTPREFKEVSLERANLIPVSELAQCLEKLPQKLDKPILVYCAHGVRSVQSGLFLEQSGYTNIFNLTGGLAQYFHDEARQK